MTPRSIRRAAERKAHKEAERKARNEMQRLAPQIHAGHAPQAEVKEAAADLPTFPTPAFSKPADAKPISAARLTANRANAQLSTGPTSADGRAKVCLNAVKTALTGRMVLLPSDDAAAYEQHVLAYTKELRPLTQRECDLAQSIADTAWRLKRIPALEMAAYAQGRVEFAQNFEDYEPSARPSLTELKTFLTYEKQLRNLQLQESRLARRYDKDTAELRKIQSERDQREQVDLDVAAKLYLAAKHDNRPFDAAARGFEFSIEEIECYLEGVRAANIAHSTVLKDRDAALQGVKTGRRTYSKAA